MNRTALSSVLLLSFGLITAAFAAAQEAQNDICSIPLVVSHFNQTTRDIEYIKDLGAKDVALRIGGKVIAPETVVVDSSPKRVVIVLDASKEIPEVEWLMALEIAAHFVSKARPNDRFALLVGSAGDPVAEWMSGAQAAQRFKSWASARPAAEKRGERNFDALMSAASLLSPPQFGDTIFLFGHPRDKGSKATSEQVQEELLKNHLRFHATTFTPDPHAIQLPEGQDIADVLKMTRDTGSYFAFQDLRLLAKPGEIQALKKQMAAVYTGIAEPYRVSFSPPPLKKRTKLEVDVRNAQGHKFGPGEALYPSAIYPCGESSN